MKRIKRYYRNKLSVEMAQLLLNILDQKDYMENICFCLTDMQDWLNKKGFRASDSAAIKRVLQDEWKLEPSPNSNSYLQFRIGTDGSIYKYAHKGRFYSITNKMVLEFNYPDDSDDSNIIN